MRASRAFLCSTKQVLLPWPSFNYVPGILHYVQDIQLSYAPKKFCEAKFFGSWCHLMLLSRQQDLLSSEGTTAR
jgi:hypothetical protein